ncbi:DUF305 domain-containing protein [Acerihabitans sp. KWT182]|uniref:DUF305 domain-containing protein n=1 Tax=Acerihabitans sp. KWT182 TaxID=3157919 RepID=A0AAU7Q854_9GAMM
MNKNVVGTLLAVLLPILLHPVWADDSMAGMKMDDPQALSPASRSYMASMKDMHEKMAEGVKASDPDVAFAQGMIPHHQGAIAMAQTELQYGKDPHMRKLAENVIKAQQAEIKTMRDWLAHHPKEAGKH